MNAKTRDALNRINRAFYAATAEDFSASRQHAWPGWRRVVACAKRLRPSGAGGEPLRVLDVGCGNGRFAGFLDTEYEGAFRYLGIDSSEPLLAIARHDQRGRSHVKFALRDVVAAASGDAAGGELASPPGPFDLILVGGLLHHVPGVETRRALLQQLARRLAPGALLVAVAWRFGAFERFRSRSLAWEDYNRGAKHPIDLDQLEPGDHLLPWGAGGRAARYCHFVDEGEMAALISGLDLAQVDEFTADGKSSDLNHYVVLRRSDV
jgi:tRNA (uracil-5-)-methyltransferase TRM9